MKKWDAIWNLKKGWLSVVENKGENITSEKSSMESRDDNLGKRWIIYTYWELEPFLLTPSSLFSLSFSTIAYFDLEYLLNTNYVPSAYSRPWRTGSVNALYTLSRAQGQRSNPTLLRSDYVNSHAMHFLTSLE